MSGKVTLPSPAADAAPSAGVSPAQVEIKQAPTAESVDPAGASDLRLIIEPADEAGHYVYTVMDRRTGKVISRLPRDEVLRLRDQSDYSAGAVFSGKV